MSTSSAMSGAPPAERRSVLVSGASFAGLATAFWLNRLGYHVTVVEVAPSLRRGGTPVDIEGETIAILTRMGLIEAVRARTLPPRRFAFKDARNATLGDMAHHPDDEAGPRYEIHRNDLLVPLRRGTRDCRLRFPARRDGGQSAGGLARGCPDQAAASRSAAAAGTGFQFHGSRSARRWAGWDAIRPSTSASQA